MTDDTSFMRDIIRGRHPYRRPADAATLILIDRSSTPPAVLLGKRHPKLAFMPGKFVFPGGRVDPADRHAPVANPLDLHVQAKLMQRAPGVSATRARALALAAIRETYEETGLLLGTRKQAGKRAGKLLETSAWKTFGEAGIMPDLSTMSLVARAVTPSGQSRRFDTRFFTADASAIAHRIEGMVGENSELIELVWMPIGETQQLDLPGITRQVLKELQIRITAGLGHDLPVPLFYARGNQRFRVTL